MVAHNYLCAYKNETVFDRLACRCELCLYCRLCTYTVQSVEALEAAPREPFEFLR
jgi:hypothetical protein